MVAGLSARLGRSVSTNCSPTRKRMAIVMYLLNGRKLGNWVSMQRQVKNRGKLDSERLKLLEDNGFIWEARTRQKSWDERYADLLRFKVAHGSCDVPARNPGDPSLGMWVVNQRQNKKRGKLTPEHERLLSEAGFVWRKNSRASASGG